MLTYPERNHNNFFTTNVLYFILLITVFYAPIINGREYLSSIILLSVFLYFTFRYGILTTPLITYICIYVILISSLDVIHMFDALDQTFFNIFKVLIYNFIPLIALLVGAMLSKKIRITQFDLITFMIGLSQIVIGILQVYNTSIEQKTLKLYSNFEKYDYFFSEIDMGRVLGSLGNPNYFGEFVVWFILIILFYYIPKYKALSQRLVLLFSLFLGVYSIILSQSRTAYILACIGIVIILLSKIKKQKLFTVIMLGIIGLVLIIYGDNVITLTRGGWESFSSFGGRVGIWINILTNYVYPFNFKLIFGYGSNFVESFILESHNYYLEVLLKYGLIGLFGYLSIMSTLIYKTFKIKSTDTKYLLLITLITLLISDMTSELSSHIKLGSFFYILLGFGLYYRKTVEFRER